MLSPPVPPRPVTPHILRLHPPRQTLSIENGPKQVKDLPQVTKTVILRSQQALSKQAAKLAGDVWNPLMK